jgi:hypothetical protein
MEIASLGYYYLGLIYSVPATHSISCREEMLSNDKLRS